MGGVHQDFPHGVCHAVRPGGHASGGRGLAHGEGFSGSNKLFGGGKDGGDGLQPAGRLADRPKESTDGRAIDPRLQNDGVVDGRSGNGGSGGRGVVLKPALFDPESGGVGDRLFLFPDQEIYLGITRIPRGGVGDGPGGGMAGGQGAV